MFYCPQVFHRFLRLMCTTLGTCRDWLRWGNKIAKRMAKLIWQEIMLVHVFRFYLCCCNHRYFTVIISRTTSNHQVSQQVQSVRNFHCLRCLDYHFHCHSFLIHYYCQYYHSISTDFLHSTQHFFYSTDSYCLNHLNYPPHLK